MIEPLKTGLELDWDTWERVFDRYDPEPVRIAYKEGYKYQLCTDYSLAIPISANQHIHSEWISLSSIGFLTIKRGYAWDGPSGPGIDTKNFMRASLVHDALYQLMREHGLDIAHRQAADRLLRSICREDGMSAIRAGWVYMSVRIWGGTFADILTHDNPVLYAP